ncbi:MAG: protein kinase [Myxococcales bacterium]|nr:protein kinase [Myxococcales bacterium]
MGTVYAAEHVATGVVAAVKTVRTTASGEDFEEEVRLVAQVQHRHVVPILDYGIAPHGMPQLAAGSPYLVMVRGQGTLESLIGSLRWSTVRQVASQLLEALGHAHALGVLHGDVKPSNVLVGVRRHPRQPMSSPTAGLALADFGIAQRLGAAEGPRGGTRAYIAPEQLHGWRAAMGPWTDLYGVGALIWALTTGAPPDPDGSFAPRQAVPPQLEGWLRRLLAAEPSQRFARACEAARALPHPSSPTSLVHPTAPAPASGTAATQHVMAPLSESTLAPPGPSAPTGVVQVPRPQPALLPADWRAATPTWPSPSLQDAGLGIWALRPAPLVGRHEDRNALWQALCAAHRSRRPQVVLLTGAEGTGRTRLIHWLAVRAHAVASAEVGSLPELARTLAVIPLDDADPRSAPQVARRLDAEVDDPCVVVAALPDGELPSAWSPLASRATVIRLGPLHPADAETLARSSLHLHPEVVLTLAHDTAGSPAALLSTLRRWIETDGLVSTPAGFRPRDEAPSATETNEATVQARLEAARAALVAGELRLAAVEVFAARATAAHLSANDRRDAEILGLQLQLDPGALDPTERLADARRLAQRASANGWSDLEALALGRLSVAVSNEGRPNEGIALAERAVRSADAHPDTDHPVRCRLYLAHMATLAGRTEQARNTLGELDALAPNHPRRAYAEVCAHIGWSVVQRRAGDSSAAEDHARAALQGAIEGGMNLERAKALRVLGTCQSRHDHYADAVITWRTYVALARDLGISSDVPIALTDLGLALEGMGEHAEAEHAFLQSLSLLRPGYGADLIPRLNLSLRYAHTGRHADAWQLIGPDEVDLDAYSWQGPPAQVHATRAAAAAGLGRHADAAAALRLVAASDQASLRSNPRLAVMLAAAQRSCHDAGFADLADLAQQAAERIRH